MRNSQSGITRARTPSFRIPNSAFRISTPSCLCCRARQWWPYCPGLARCTGCGYVRVTDDLPPEQIRALYQEAYFRGDEYRDYGADRAVIEATLTRRLCRVRRGVAPGGRLIEVGCAYGFFLSLAADDYPTSVGADVAESATRFARDQLGVDARTGALPELDLPAAGFDAACMWDTIEHLADPGAVVAHLAALVRPGGWLFLTTGDIGALVPRLQGRRWRLIHPPSHLHYFSRGSMKRFLAARGFAVRCITTCAVDRSVEQIVHGLSRFGSSGRLRRMAARAHAHLPAWLGRQRIPLDLGDIMLVEARRTATTPARSG